MAKQQQVRPVTEGLGISQDTSSYLDSLGAPIEGTVETGLQSSAIPSFFTVGVVSPPKMNALCFLSLDIILYIIRVRV